MPRCGRDCSRPGTLLRTIAAFCGEMFLSHLQGIPKLLGITVVIRVACRLLRLTCRLGLGADCYRVLWRGIFAGS
jgi:hypothetical protein